MDIKTKILLKLMHDNDYFENLNYYLNEMVKENKLTYKNLKYLYDNLYKDKSSYLKQNIYPVSQFLIKGYSTEEAQNIAKILPDAHNHTIFCYDKKEVGYVYSRLFKDLQFAYNQYDGYIKLCMNKEDAYQLVKNDIETTSIKQREIETAIIEKDLYTKELIKDAYETINKQRDRLKEEFKTKTIYDKKLIEYFKDDNPKDRFSDILVAGAIIGKIELRNLWRENGKLDGEKENIPYNEEQINMIDRFYSLGKTIDRLDYYAEYVFEDEEEFE